MTQLRCMMVVMMMTLAGGRYRGLSKQIVAVVLEFGANAGCLWQSGNGGRS